MASLCNLNEFSRFDYALRWISEPQRWTEHARGHEDFHFPGTTRLLDLVERPDIVHCFNLHGGYFDLSKLPWLSHQVPVVLDLRDAWLLSGHCAHSFDCERWKIGCGQCPDLNINPAIPRDATAYNWQRKKDIFSKSQVCVATPSRWLMNKVKQSILAPAIREARVIPTGVDLNIFHPFAKRSARAELELPQDAKILLIAANGIRKNPWKDYRTARLAVASVGERARGGRIVLLALGEQGEREQIGAVEIRFVPHIQGPERVARYYQAADVYLHSAIADTFPRAVLEALACGTPVIATAVGGIPEQITTLEKEGASGADHPTGILVAPSDAEEMGAAIETLLMNQELRGRLGDNAAKDARERFNLRKQADRYLTWYEELLKARQ
jgi:glycosyltransferase involved in cell wall biosynthesis